jgi:acyl carrier protein
MSIAATLLATYIGTLRIDCGGRALIDTIRTSIPGRHRHTVLFISGLFGGGWMSEPIVAALTARGRRAGFTAEPLAGHATTDDIPALVQNISSPCSWTDRPSRRRSRATPNPKEPTMATTLPTYTTLVDWLTNRVAAYLNTQPAAIATDTAIGDYGLDSASALALCRDLEYEFGIVVEPTLVWDYPTIDAIAGHLTAQLRTG